MPHVQFDIEITGTATDKKTGKVVPVSLLRVQSFTPAGTAAGGDPLVINATATLTVSKAALEKAIGGEPGFTGNASLKTTASVSATDLCGCSAGDAKTFASPDLRTFVSVDSQPITVFLPCSSTLATNIVMSISGDELIAVINSVVTISPNECLPGELRNSIKLQFRGTFAGDPVVKTLPKVELSPSLRSIKTSPETVTQKESIPFQQIRAEIRQNFDAATPEQVNAVLATLVGVYAGSLSDGCGCKHVVSFEVKP